MNEAITGSAATPRARSREHLFTVMGAVALALATFGLFLISRGKWSDAIVDSGREWIVPDALARGELLYRDVVYWFGPFTPYFHAAFFRVFGSSLSILVLAGIVASIGVLAALFFALRSVTGRREAVLWTALAIPALVFMPNGGGPILGMGYRIWHAAAFTLSAVALASRPNPRRPLLSAAGAGALSALAGLCRTEWGFAAALGVLLATYLRTRSRRGSPVSAAVSAATFVVIFCGIIGAFILAAGWDAVVEDGHVLLTGLPPETQEFLVAFSGVRDWKTGLAEMVYSAAMWLGVFLLVRLFSEAQQQPGTLRRNGLFLSLLLIVLALSAGMGGAGGAVVFSAAPLLCLVAVVVGFRCRYDPAAAALAASGLLGVLLSYRRPFHIMDSAYVGPPLLFAFVCTAGLMRLSLAEEKTAALRHLLRTAFHGLMVVLVIVGFAGRALQYESDSRVALSGTGGMISARPEFGRQLAILSESIKREARKGEGLVVFPEGEIVNYLSGLHNPIRHKLFIPGYLTAQNEGEIIEELERSRPAAVAVLFRPTGEYGHSEFGVTYGRRIWSWIERNYSIRRIDERGRPSTRRSSPMLGLLER